MKPCNHTIPYRNCRICFLYDTDPKYKQLWTTTKPEPLKQDGRQCIHLGEYTNTFKKCFD